MSVLRRSRALLSCHGSTRSVALIRIGLALILWTTWGDHMVIFRRLTPPGAVVAVVFFASTTLMLVGYRSRLATLVAGVTCTVIYNGDLIDIGASLRHHHTALMCLSTVLLSLTPCGRSLSVDRWLAVRRARRRGAPPPPERGDLWAVKLLALTLSAVYFGAAVSKSNAGWLSGDRFEMLLTHYYLGSDWIGEPWLATAMQLATVYVVALEWALCFGLWWAPARRWLIPQGIVLHWGFYVLLPVVTFSLTTVLLYLAFVPPDVVHRAIDRLLGPEI